MILFNLIRSAARAPQAINMILFNLIRIVIGSDVANSLIIVNVFHTSCRSVRALIARAHHHDMIIHLQVSGARLRWPRIILVSPCYIFSIDPERNITVIKFDQKLTV